MSISTPIKNSPRKLAKQARSKQTVEDILASCAELIKTIGIAQITTNKIADHSGVNIASIYQYFPNKDALIAALTNQLMAQSSLKIQALITSLEGQSIASAARETISIYIDIFRQSEGLLLHLFTNFGSATRVPGNEDFQNDIKLAGKRFLDAHKDELRVKDYDKALYILSNALSGLLFRYLIESPNDMNDAELTDELVHLVTAYLCLK